MNERGQTAAWRASRDGNLEKLRCLHKANADFDISDKKGASPLLAASDKGNVAGVRFLLDCGAHVNLQAGPGDGTHAVAPFASPLYNACQNGNEEIVQLLLGARAKVHERTADGATALMVAAQNGHEKVFSRVLAAGETTVNLETPTGLTALYFAAQNGHTGIVSMLLKATASTEGRSRDGAAALFKAAQNGHQEAVVPLLQHRADVFAAAHDGTTPLILAAYNGNVNVDVVDVLVPEIINRVGVKGLNFGMQSSGATAMFVAAQAGKDGVVRKLGLYGADVRQSLSSGAGPIHIAAQLGRLKVLKELLAAKADVEARGPDGVAALYLASKNDHLESAKHLLEQGADPDACLDSGHTPLLAAWLKSLGRMVLLLVRAGANPALAAAAAKKSGQTAVIHQNQEVIAACGDTCKLRISYEEDVHLMDLEFKVHRIGPHGTAYLANPWTHEHYEPAVSCNDLVMVLSSSGAAEPSSRSHAEVHDD